MFKLIIILFLITVNSFSSEIKWINSYEEATILAKKENKSIFLLITKESCPFCFKFENTTLKDKEIISKLNNYFISVNLIKNKDKLPLNLKANMIPFSYIINPKNNKIVEEVPGLIDIEDFNFILDIGIKNL